MSAVERRPEIGLGPASKGGLFMPNPPCRARRLRRGDDATPRTQDHGGFHVCFPQCSAWIGRARRDGGLSSCVGFPRRHSSWSWAARERRPDETTMRSPGSQQRCSRGSPPGERTMRAIKIAGLILAGLALLAGAAIAALVIGGGTLVAELIESRASAALARRGAVGHLRSPRGPPLAITGADNHVAQP